MDEITERLAREAEANNPFIEPVQERLAKVILTNNPSTIPKREIYEADLVIDTAKKEIYKCRWADPNLMTITTYNSY